MKRGLIFSKPEAVITLGIFEIGNRRCTYENWGQMRDIRRRKYVSKCDIYVAPKIA